MEDLQSCESSFVLRYLRLFAVKGIKTLLIINFSLLPATSGYPEATLVILCVSAVAESCGNRNPATVMPENFSSDHKESLPQYKLLDWVGAIIRP